MLQRTRRDEGFTLIEVMVALLVFGILATGVVAAANNIIRMTGDNRARATAANLAAQDIDLARAQADPFKVTANKQTIPVSGRDYTVVRTISWISSAGADIGCNSSTNLFYLRVNVRVTWPGMLGSTAAVQDDTIMAPNGRISDTGSGSIAVSVTGVDAKPQSGVTVTITPTSGGKTLTTQPKATGADGCTYANQVAPGTYEVAISKTGWIDDSQVQSPKKSVVVVAGGTQSATFQYDQAATYNVAYTTGPAGSVYAARPNSFDTNFLSTSGTYTVTTAPASLKLHPWPSGYSVVVGRMGSGATTCASLDPAAWSADGALGSGVRTPVATTPGGTASVNAPMGVVQVTAPIGRSITVTSATPQGAGNPGCSVTGVTYAYSVGTASVPVNVSVPYGSWTVKIGGVNATASQVKVLTNTAGGGVAADGTVTLDPRPAR